MNRKLLVTVGMFCLLATGASAQGIVGGAQQGAEDGNRAAGPVGGVVGSVVGGVAGGVSGLLGLDQRPRFREYVVREKHPSYRWDGSVVVGSELPRSGVTYYDVPSEYGVRDRRYTVVNDRTVIVDPRTNRIVEVVE